MKNAKKALAVVEAVEPKPTEAQTQKPEPKPAEPPVTRQLAVWYYRQAISEIETMIKLIDCHPKGSDVEEEARYDAQSLSDAMFLHRVLSDAGPGNHMIDTESPMVGAMLFNLGIDAEMLRNANVEEA